MKVPDYDTIHQRGRALEEVFFAERDRQLLESLRRKLSSDEARQMLVAATGVTDELKIPELAGISTPQFLAVLGVFPLVEVAWCDRHISSSERAAILTSAHEMGVTSGTPCHALLDRWLVDRPAGNAVQLWTDYVRAICATLDPDVIAKLKTSVMARARKIAAAAGGVMGVGNKVSAAEQACLDRLAAAFTAQSP